MASVQVPVGATVRKLKAAVKRLSPAELRQFTRWFAQWQDQNGWQSEDEAALLARIEENSRLPRADQQRYQRLRRKCERRTLTLDEHAQYTALLQQLEARNVKRIEALIALAKRR